ncbi:hypothetical protein [Kribbia dieselivorans]|uniref:hypothetical protein n=1 Tax=Kribbia dieselivorans TaxID=331526 RepID=UPI0012ECC2C0|nr:hypothetical protein [Kribbia dieselivorans]
MPDQTGSTPSQPTDPTPAQPAPTTPERPSFLDHSKETGQRLAGQAVEGGRRALIFGAFAVGAVLALMFGWFLFGEWWISIVRNQVAGSVFRGWTFGFVIGFGCTLASAIFLWLLFRRKMWMWLRVTLGVFAALPLLPLAFSLRVRLNEINDNKGSLEYQMLTDGRGYQTGVTVGLVLALVIIGFLVWWTLDRKWRRRKAEKADTAER